MSKKPVILITALVILALLGFLVISSVKPSKTTTTTQIQPTQSVPQPTRETTPVPVTIKTERGSITAVSSSSISVNAGGQTQVFTLSAKTEVYRLTAGTLEGGNAQTSLVTAKDLAVGQQVMVVVDKNSQALKSIVIIK